MCSFEARMRASNLTAQELLSIRQLRIGKGQDGGHDALKTALFVNDADDLPGELHRRRRIFTICSSLNRVFFMAPSLPVRAIFLGFRWADNRPAGQYVRTNDATHKRTRASPLKPA